MTPPTMHASPAGSTHGNRRWVRVPHEVHMDQMRRRAGRAYIRLSAGAGGVAAAIGLKNHAGASRRRQGHDGPLAPMLAEIAALEHAGIDTTPIIGAIIETQVEARSAEDMCPQALSNWEQSYDNAESTAQIAFLSKTGTAEGWRQSLIEYVAVAKQVIASLQTAGGVR